MVSFYEFSSKGAYKRLKASVAIARLREKARTQLRPILYYHCSERSRVTARPVNVFSCSRRQLAELASVR
jgi:hypothetical protein